MIDETVVGAVRFIQVVLNGFIYVNHKTRIVSKEQSDLCASRATFPPSLIRCTGKFSPERQKNLEAK